MQFSHQPKSHQGFRLRGLSTSRIDSFSDIVFGFALTLIVVSSAVPHTFDQLRTVLLGFYAFAICFCLFIFIWLAHFNFFRRYGLHDATTMWINFALLFTVLAYIYPLKFLFSFAAHDTGPGVFSSLYQRRDLVVIYGAGFAALQLCYAALYGNAWLKRTPLHLSPLEIALTLADFWNYIGTASVGLLCCLLAFLLPLAHASRAFYGFFLLIVWGRIQAIVSARRIRAARARTAPQELEPFPSKANAA
jgi:Endosomal/lysosomal potassium channel TMEM175